MFTVWKNKTIEQELIYADSTVKEITDLFETRVENLEPRDEKKNLLWPPRKRKTGNPARKGKEMTPTQVL